MASERVELYSVYERVWHWMQAIFILAMMWTGWCIHSPDSWMSLPFAYAVTIHNVLGFLVLVNAAFGLFYYLATGTIRQYLPRPHGFGVLAVKQARYYLHGIFRREPHPLEKTAESRLNPLQQLTYLMILNILLPLQVASGMLMWSGRLWPEEMLAVGGVALLSSLHTLGAWLFAGFVMAHIYLTTTGHTLTSNLRAMIWGYELLPVQGTGSGQHASSVLSTPSETHS